MARRRSSFRQLNRFNASGIRWIIRGLAIGRFATRFFSSLNRFINFLEMGGYCRDGKAQMMRLSHSIAHVANLFDFFTFADNLEKPRIGFLHLSVILNSPGWNDKAARVSQVMGASSKRSAS
jgi:hypothetical protein